MKIKGWYFISDGCDGSGVPSFHTTKESAEAQEAYELERYGQGFCDAVDSFEFEVRDDGTVDAPFFTPEEDD